jgi:hypothetical protein
MFPREKENQIVGLTFDFAKSIMPNYWRFTFFSFAIIFGELPNSKICQTKNPKLLELLYISHLESLTGHKGYDH